MRKEFHLFEAYKASPIVDWLKALCRTIKADSGTKDVGAIDMRLAGNFTIPQWRMTAYWPLN
jgi:hypothetical protein|tara:strand:+ start:165 stop:350 length:186 start_codon:yes stop_codon:yes gene_type:complete